jgi:hypothetical protein
LQPETMETGFREKVQGAVQVPSYRLGRGFFGGDFFPKKNLRVWGKLLTFAPAKGPCPSGEKERYVL